jgi:cobalt/nickel transport protein
MRGRKARIIAGLGIPVAVALFLSPFASSLPDGLEKSAASLGFLHREHTAMQAPMGGYAVPGVRNGTVSVAFAGAAGTLLSAGAAFLLARLLKRKHPK